MVFATPERAATKAGTPLQGPNTNLAGVFQINDITQVNGRTRTFNSWLVTVPGFFGKATQATLTVYAVNGTAPAVVTGNEQPITNIVRETFTHRRLTTHPKRQGPHSRGPCATPTHKGTDHADRNRKPPRARRRRRAASDTPQDSGEAQILR